MSRWSTQNPERMSEIARLPLAEQNDALRAEASAIGEYEGKPATPENIVGALMHIYDEGTSFPCRGCAATRVSTEGTYCPTCVSEALGLADEPSPEQLDAEYEAQKYDDMREQR